MMMLLEAARWSTVVLIFTCYFIIPWQPKQSSDVNQRNKSAGSTESARVFLACFGVVLG